MITATQAVRQKKPRKFKTAEGRETVFSCNLRELREAIGLTMREVAKFTGVEPSTVLRAEIGMELHLSSALKLAKFFEKTVGAIWDFKKPNGSK